ncbi:MAG: hypothetical protein JNM39_13175 [Bdellovibrionaceae bacterium]|nr:hypothetical protein [Pseudobdellovibrionaceae bacterium]
MTINKRKFLASFLISFGFLFSCQTLSTSYLDGLKTGPNHPDLDFTNIQNLVAQGQCTQAINDIVAYTTKFPTSPYSQSLSLLQNDCLVQTEQFETAANSLRQLVVYSIDRQPKIAAPAFLLLSYAYEGLGENDKSLAAALDAERLGAELPAHSRLAEVPARLAMLHSQMSDMTQAGIYLSRADDGIRVLRSQNPQTIGSVFWAKVYYQMGFKSLDQIDHQGISNAIQGLMAVQKFTLRSIEFNDPVWSARALNQLQKNYLTLWRLIEIPVISNSPMWVQDEVKDQRQRSIWIFELEDLINQARLFQPHESHPQPPMTVDFFAFLNDLDGKALALASKSAKKNPLTKESLFLNSTLRPGHVYPTQFFPNEVESPNPTPSEENQ